MKNSTEDDVQQVLNYQEPLVAVYLITYRRHTLLRRSIASVLTQTHHNLQLYVVNDDPEDEVVAKIVDQLADSRARIFEPTVKRGATGSFALVFEEREADFVALLEDDNWWESTFLEKQLAAIGSRQDVDVVVGNERVWREESDGHWTDTGEEIWPFTDIREHQFTLESIAGPAVYCNSSALVRVKRKCAFTIPAHIPVDVTEHFRERTFSETILLNGESLTNFAVTRSTARNTNNHVWSHYQQMLIASCFAALIDHDTRRDFSRQLWRSTYIWHSPRAVTLVLSGLAVPAARSLIREAPISALFRAFLTVIRRPKIILRLDKSNQLTDAYNFLVNAPLTKSCATRYEIYRDTLN